MLHDLDKWIESQWETFPTKRQYAKRNPYRGLRDNSKLKEMYIVRYADDFKIFTKTHELATKIFYAVKIYLQRNLKLTISIEKSKITNLRKHSSEFLGFEIRAVRKNNKYVSYTHISKKNKKIIQQNVKRHMKKLQEFPVGENARNYNAYILGIHQYYLIATHVNKDFAAINYKLMYRIYNRLKNTGKYEVPRDPPETYKRFYKNKFRTFRIANVYLYPLGDIKWRLACGFTQSVCNYTELGRMGKDKKLESRIITELYKMLNYDSHSPNVEYSDNRLSKYSMQRGKCAITGIFFTCRGNSLSSYCS